MEVGLQHLHRTLAYLVFLVALVDTVLVLTRGRSDPRTATAMHWIHNLGLLMAGRLNILLGLVTWYLLPHRGLDVWWMWVSLLLWGGIEMAAIKLVKPEVGIVRAGGTASGRLMLGVFIELAIVITVFGLMSAQP